MQIVSWNAELAIANLQFKRLFSNIVIERTNSKTEEVKKVKVDCKLDQRSRILKNWENAEKRAKMQLPMITISRTGYQRNPDRLNNLHNEVKYEITRKNRNENLLTPVPIDINYEVSIIAKYPSDIDQIASNFMVFFNSDVYVQTVHPKYEGVFMNNQVILGDSVTEEHPSELEPTADDLITSTFTFTFKTYLFGGTQRAKLSNDIYIDIVPIINQLCIGFYPIPYLCSDMAEHMRQVDTVYSKELSEVSGYYSSSRKNPFDLSVNVEGLSVRVPEREWLEPMYTRSAEDSYVDRISTDKVIWTIDQN